MNPYHDVYSTMVKLFYESIFISIARFEDHCLWSIVLCLQLH